MDARGRQDQRPRRTGLPDEADPGIYSWLPYMGPSGWIGVSLADDADWALVEARLATSWRLAAPRRLAEA